MKRYFIYIDSQYIIIIKLTSASIKDFYFVEEIYCRNLGGEVYE